QRFASSQPPGQPGGFFFSFLQPDGERRLDVAAIGPPDRQAIAGTEHCDEVPEGSANELADGGEVDDRGAVRTHEPPGQDALEVFQRSTHPVPLLAGVKPDVVAGAVDPVDAELVDDDAPATRAEDEDPPRPAPALDGSPRRARRREALVLDASEAQPRGGLRRPAHGPVLGWAATGKRAAPTMTSEDGSCTKAATARSASGQEGSSVRSSSLVRCSPARPRTVNALSSRRTTKSSRRVAVAFSPPLTSVTRPLWVRATQRSRSRLEVCCRTRTATLTRSRGWAPPRPGSPIVRSTAAAGGWVRASAILLSTSSRLDPTHAARPSITSCGVAGRSSLRACA